MVTQESRICPSSSQLEASTVPQRMRGHRGLHTSSECVTQVPTHYTELATWSCLRAGKCAKQHLLNFIFLMSRNVSAIGCYTKKKNTVELCSGQNSKGPLQPRTLNNA